MNFDTLPDEILREIARDSEPVYKALILAYPHFARMVNVYDAMINFGHDVKIVNSIICWYRNGKLHRVNGPARVDRLGNSEWYRDGLLHRDGGPARVLLTGREWYQNGVLHCDDGPAMIWVGGR